MFKMPPLWSVLIARHLILGALAMPCAWSVAANSSVDINTDSVYRSLAATPDVPVQDGPNPGTLPVDDCLTGSFSTSHSVEESSSGRYTATELTGSHRFDASDIVFGGFHDNGNFTPWPIKITPLETTRFGRETGVLTVPQSGETHHTFDILIPAGIPLVHFYLRFGLPDTDRNLYMKVTDPDGQGTFYNHPTGDYESVVVNNPISGIWSVRAAIRAGAGEDANYTLTVDDHAGEPASGCWHGGQINGAWDENGTGVYNPDDGLPVSWEDPFHHSGVMTIEVDNFLMENVSAYNHGDGLRSIGDNNTIDGAYLKDIHDDCVENDRLNNLLVTDSFFDGCYVGFSARTFDDSGYDGSNKVFEIRDSLVRLEPQPTVYKPEVYGPGPGHGQFFKWDSNPEISIKLSLHNTIFLATQENRHGGGLGVEEVSHLESCSNNVMVWAGQGEFPNAANLPKCFRLTTNIAQWHAAVASWHARYPNRGQ